MKIKLSESVNLDNSAFTLVEVALAIGLVAFALSAIIGILPMGMRVQEKNLEDTIINQDGPIIMEAIRSGSTNLALLESSIDWLRRVEMSNGVPIFTNVFTNANNPENIVGQLSQPKYDPNFTTEFIGQAKFVAGSGSLLIKDTAPAVRAMAFSYLVTSEVIPLQTRINANPTLTNSVYDIKLTLNWPIRPGSTPNSFRVGRGKKVFRSTVTGYSFQSGENFFIRPGIMAPYTSP
ncbi:hypothetical protein N9B94_00830 [Verrucomicrobia bacterium]|nr:hypothetical protein [Verrucomicrobiota bacterium]